MCCLFTIKKGGLCLLRVLRRFTFFEMNRSKHGGIRKRRRPPVCGQVLPLPTCWIKRGRYFCSSGWCICWNTLNNLTIHPARRLPPRPPGYWRDIENQKDFIEDAAQRLHIKEVRKTRGYYLGVYNEFQSGRRLVFCLTQTINGFGWCNATSWGSFPVLPIIFGVPWRAMGFFSIQEKAGTAAWWILSQRGQSTCWSEYGRTKVGCTAGTTLPCLPFLVYSSFILCC